jgi:dUTP pyrophosphatase
MSLEIKIKYHVEGLEKIKKIEKGDWIDLRSAYDEEFKTGEFGFIDLGISIKIPKGYEAHLAPRSSTFKNYGILQVNSVGIIDESYSGNEDIVKMPIYATRNTLIKKNDRICQFRIIEKMPEVTIIEVDNMEDESRGGFGSTGVN